MRIILLLLLFVSSYAQATTYYVKNGGSDSNTGLSDAQAWATVGKVNGFTFATSDDVYFLAGDSWSGTRLYMDYNGTSGNRFTVGAYYLNSGNETIGVPDGINKPIMQGGFTTHTAIGSVPSSYSDGMIVIHANYVTVQNFNVKDSSGKGIIVGGGGNNYAIIEDNYIQHSVSSSIYVYQNSDYAIVRNNISEDCAHAVFDGIKPYSSHPLCIGIKTSDSGLVENNTIYDSWGEGIGLWTDTKYYIVRGNLIANTKHVGIYIDNASDNVVEQNMILGQGVTSDPFFRGIAVEVEDTVVEYSSTNNLIRNNLIAGVTTCFRSSVWTAPLAAGKQTGGWFIGNTCVAATSDAIEFAKGDAAYTTWEVANNIFWDIDNGATGCKSPTDADITYHHNSWDTNPTDTDCDGTGDVYGDPVLNDSTSDFSLFDYLNQPTSVDFEPTSGSNAEDAGVAIDTTVLTAGNFPLSGDLAGSCTFNLDEMTQDYICTTRHATTPDIGGLELGGEAPPGTETLPFYMNVGGGEQILSKTYSTEQYHVADSSYTDSTTTAVAGTTDDAVYQTWRGGTGSKQWSIPISNQDVDITLLFNEQYWGDEAGTCTFSGPNNRFFDITIEGILIYNEYDICATAGAANTAVRLVIPGITIADGTVDIVISDGSTGVDNKGELFGVEVAAAAPTGGDTLTIGNSTPTTTVDNVYSDSSPIAAVTVCGATTTTGDTISIAGTNTAGITSGTVAVVNDSIEYTPANATVTGSVGSFVATLADSENSDTCTISITLQLERKLTFTVFDTNGTAIASSSGWSWCVYETTGDILDTTESYCGALGDESTNSSGQMVIGDPRLPDVLTQVRWYIFNNNSVTGTDGARFYRWASGRAVVAR